jgi:transposase
MPTSGQTGTNLTLRVGGADHPYVPLLLTMSGIGWVLAFTIAAEIGDIARFPSAKKLCGYATLCPPINQSGDKDRRGPLTKQGLKYLRWAMLEATMHALKHPLYRERCQRTQDRFRTREMKRGCSRRHACRRDRHPVEKSRG